MTEISIIKQDGDRKGRYVATIEGVEGEGEITYTRPEPGIISANHTGVPDSMAGQGVAKALLEFMLEDARRENFRIIPVCPYIRKQYAAHPEWSELFTTKPGNDV
ncbi:GNAT family N-acetyltransferase [Paracoccus aerodenitrificans]|uniref:GNAT family N-acetyltransferase n=1 Tax=Paracoccus aerodenitrificans TaxID=3017781 RepID=UPI0022F01B57|nr:GNAT family N-acetyltransferase [Paracoccus aerodenitrificans]WBU62698.1 GNAT family N-acetyltransferase [Paracoccus aerodenitrificans]